MSLQATKKDAQLVRYVPRWQQLSGTSLHPFADSPGMVTVQIFNPQASQAGTAFNDDLSLKGQWILNTVPRSAYTLTGMLNEIRQAFGFNIKQLASVMQSSRVSIYEWMRQDNLSMLRGSTRLRLNHLHMLSLEWLRMESIPGDYINEELSDRSGTLASVLAKDVLPTPIRLKCIHEMLVSVQSAEERRIAYGRSQSKSIADGAAKILANPKNYGLVTD